jgi:hypothetical protein
MRDGMTSLSWFVLPKTQVTGFLSLLLLETRSHYVAYAGQKLVKPRLSSFSQSSILRLQSAVLYGMHLQAWLRLQHFKDFAISKTLSTKAWKCNIHTHTHTLQKRKNIFFTAAWSLKHINLIPNSMQHSVCYKENSAKLRVSPSGMDTNYEHLYTL